MGQALLPGNDSEPSAQRGSPGDPEQGMPKVVQRERQRKDHQARVHLRRLQERKEGFL
ncbi:UNVERIFIED_CONTAM: hypothetical protein GTU68_007505 [Idotea baltica]|nr:hypothetical protein [Idotea baltica]